MGQVRLSARRAAVCLGVIAAQAAGLVVAAALAVSLIVAAAQVAAFIIAAANAADAPTLEYPIKATFLEKFSDFVTWPADALPAADSAFDICIYGEDPFGPVIDKVVLGQMMSGHPVAVKRLQDGADPAVCHILYLGKTPAPDAVLSSAAGHPVLTVTDSTTWSGEPHGIIHFVLRDNRVRFIIDDQAASDSRLTISSKLLAVALSVNPRAKAAP